MAQLTEDEINVMIMEARLDERERCAVLAEALATHYEASAERLRREGSYTVRALWPFGKLVTCIRPQWEAGAIQREAAAHGLRNAIARGCREGWDARKVKPHEQGMALRTGVDGDPSLVNLDQGVHHPGRDPTAGEII